MTQGQSSLQAAERLLQTLPNPSKIKEIHLDIKWVTPTGHDWFTGLGITGFIVLAVIVIALCFTVADIKATRR